MLLELLIGPQRAGDDDRRTVRGGSQGELVTHEMSGKHYEQMLRGNMFIYHINSFALLTNATPWNVPTVVNPPGSGRIFVPIALRFGFISGTTTIGGVVIGETTKVGAIATGSGSPILTGTRVEPFNALRGSGRASDMWWLPQVNTFTAAAGPTVIASTGINFGAAAPSVPGPYECKFDGGLAFLPGTAMSIMYTVATTTSVWHITLLGLELPLPLAA